MKKEDEVMEFNHVSIVATANVIARLHLGRPLESTPARNLGMSSCSAMERSTLEDRYTLSTATPAIPTMMTTLKKSGTPDMPASFIATTKGDAAEPDPPKRRSSFMGTMSVQSTMLSMYRRALRYGMSFVARPMEMRGVSASPARIPTNTWSPTAQRARRAQLEKPLIYVSGLSAGIRGVSCLETIGKNWQSPPILAIVHAAGGATACNDDDGNDYDDGQPDYLEQTREVFIIGKVPVGQQEQADNENHKHRY
ncbi:hypothetical protein SLS54_005115 [Diplodia seriata]